MNQNIEGVIVPILTLFDETGQLDAPAMTSLVDFLVERGISGLFPGGTTGEGLLLSTRERQRLAEITVEAAEARVPVIVHTGAITTAETLALTEHARAIGAQAVAIVPPFYYHHSDETLLQHFEQVAAAVPDFPVYLYNNPAVANNSLSPALVFNLVDRCSNIVGIKDSSGSIDYLAAMTSLRGGAFNTASGSDGQILAAQAIGCHACVSGNANVVPELVVSLFDAASAGDLILARRLQRQLNKVRRIVEDGADLSLFKAIVVRRGLAGSSVVRAPLREMSSSQIENRWQALSRLNLVPSPAGDLLSEKEAP
ncbi:MAG: dihydrodipicolinate synthase family protein [Chloroflexota bacterium]|nr:dihydrodipicolinate synthase family protein [Chloroflexota bacterium]